MRKDPQFRLVKSAFFRKVGDIVYLRNVATGEEFLFSKESGPIFSALRKGAGDDVLILRRQGNFLQELKELGLVESAECPPPVSSVVRALPPDCVRTPDNLTLRLQEECRRRHILWSAGIELTYRCNERCRHCYLDIREEQNADCELNQGDWFRVVDQLARMGCMNVLVTGGEPTLHSSFLAICRHIIKRGMLCDVYTNGLAISDGLFKDLCDLPLNSISVSLYGGSASFHDEVTGVPGSFQKTLSTLLRFKDAGFGTYAKVPIFHGHLDDYFAAKELGREKGFRILASNILVPGHSGKTRNQMMMDEVEYRQFLERDTVPNTCVEDVHSVEKIKLEPLCQAGQSTLCVSPFGDVMPCNSFPAVCGNIREASISKIWRTSDIFNRLRKICRHNLSSRCETCGDIAYCTVCPGASWSEANGQILPCTWSCEQAHVRADFNRAGKHKGMRK